MLRLLKYTILAVLSIWLIACTSAASPEKVAKEYMQAFTAGDINAVMKMLHVSEEDKEEMMQGKVAMLSTEMANQTKKRGGVKDITTAAAVYSDDKNEAEVEVTIVFKDDGEPAVDTIELIKANGKWLVKLF